VFARVHGVEIIGTVQGVDALTGTVRIGVSGQRYPVLLPAAHVLPLPVKAKREPWSLMERAGAWLLSGAGVTAIAVWSLVLLQYAQR